MRQGDQAGRIVALKDGLRHGLGDVGTSGDLNLVFKRGFHQQTDQIGVDQEGALGDHRAGDLDVVQRQDVHQGLGRPVRVGDAFGQLAADIAFGLADQRHEHLIDQGARLFVLARSRRRVLAQRHDPHEQALSVARFAAPGQGYQVVGSVQQHARLRFTPLAARLRQRYEYSVNQVRDGPGPTAGAPMTERLLLALDQGTTSTRAMVFTERGQVLAQASRPLKQAYPADGWVEHDADEIVQAAVAVLRDAVQACGRPISHIAALGITNQRETTVVWDKAGGRPIHPAIVWQDRRTADVCERLRDQGLEAEVSAVTGLLLDPYFSATKIAWILDRVPGARAAAEAGTLLAGTIDSWLVWRLTGGRIHATDATNASRTLLLDIRTGAWSPRMAELFDVPLSLMPQVRDTAGDFGEVTSDILGAPMAIRGVVGDQQGALMGQGCIDAGQMKATYGTGCFMLLHTGAQPHISKSRLLTTIASRLNGVAAYALEGALFIAGAAIQWINEGLGVPGGPKAVEALALQARPDHGVILAPAFTGLGAPWWDAGARGAILGLTRDSGLPEICAAAYDGCALQTRDLIEAMRTDAPEAFAGRATLKIDGGMASSAFFRRRLADLTGLGRAAQPNPGGHGVGCGAVRRDRGRRLRLRVRRRGRAERIGELGAATCAGCARSGLRPLVGGYRSHPQSLVGGRHLQIGDHVDAVLWIGQAGEGHLGAGQGLGRAAEPGVQMFGVPGPAGGFHRVGIAEPGRRSRLASEDSVQIGSGHVGPARDRRMAGHAQRELGVAVVHVPGVVGRGQGSQRGGDLVRGRRGRRRRGGRRGRSRGVLAGARRWRGEGPQAAARAHSEARLARVNQRDMKNLQAPRHSGGAARQL